MWNDLLNNLPLAISIVLIAVSAFFLNKGAREAKDYMEFCDSHEGSSGRQANGGEGDG